jgi:glycosyltransferase involved in cell wall biosynthesis
MTRVLIVEASGDLWGSERALLDLLGTIANLDIAVCCPPLKALTFELQRRNIPILPYYVYGLHEKSRLYRVKAAAGVLRACMHFRPDVIYLNQSGCYKVALPAARILDLPLVAHVRIFEDAAYLASQTPSPNRLATIIAISAAIEAEVRKFKELKSILVQRVYDGYSPSNCVRTLETSQVAKRIACVGRVVPIKGQDILTKALCLLSESGESAECVFLGEGDAGFIKELKDSVSHIGSSIGVQWLGFVSDVFPVLKTCSVLVCPSHREPLGRVILEAWDAGVVPIVFAGSGGAAEIVAAADAGILYHEQRPASLAGALSKAFELSAGEREQLVRRGRAWTQNNCGLKTYGRAITSILLEAI